MVAPNGSTYDKVAPETQRNQVLKKGSKAAGAEDQKGQETNEVYEETGAIGCHQDSPTPPQYTGNTSILQTKKPIQ